MKMLSRTQKAKYNIATSLCAQFVSLICGIIVPQLMIRSFGSEIYGATTSIAHFLAYISLIEGGVAGVARAGLYKPLADNDIEKISAVINEIKRFFRIIAIVFVAYVIVIAITYKYIADTDALDWSSSFLLVVIISLSTLAQYYFGITNSILLNADQRNYINNIISFVTIITNTIAIVILVNLGCNIFVVKLVSSIVFVLKPMVLSLYVSKYYKIDNKIKSDSSVLTQKWTALGQHIAYFLHSNTDVVVLTVFANLKSVAVYSIYNMIVTSVRSVVSAFSGGMESVFGNMYAQAETDKLKRVFSYYETLISIVAVIFFSTTSILIIPFVKLYTHNITDANYIAPVFSIFIIMAEFVYCVRMPYHYLTIATNSFIQTRTAAYGEAILNIVLSIVLVIKFDLAGVAIATFVAVLFRMGYYAYYLSINIIHRSFLLFIKRISINFFALGGIFVVSKSLISFIDIETYYKWGIVGVVQVLFSTIITIVTNCIFYKDDIFAIWARISKKYLKNGKPHTRMT